VNEPQTAAEAEAVRNAIERQAPFGEQDWCRRKAAEMGLEQSMAPRGRPRRSIVTTK